MGLGLPLALLGLLSLAIPLWLHRMRRRVERERRLPTVALLARAKAEDRRPTIFHDLPLLLARLAVLACLVFALARPHLWTDDPVVGNQPVAFACVLDDSLSMQRQADGESLVEQARERAEAVLSAIPAGSEVALIAAGAPPRLLHARDRDVQSALDALALLEAGGARATDLPGAVGLARAQLEGSSLPDRRIWLLTDCTRSSGVEELATQDPDVWVQCLGAGEASQENAYIEQLSLLPDPGSAEHVQLAVDVRSTLDEEVVPVEVRVDGEVIAHGEVAVHDHQGRVLLDVDPRTLREARAGTVVLTKDDALSADNERPLLGALSSGPTVLLVDGSPSLQRLDDELRLIGLALDTPIPDGTPLNVMRTDFEGMADADLERADVIVLANAPVPPTSLVHRIARCVDGGAGLFIGVGDMADPFAYRGALGALLPADPRGSADASPPLLLAPAEPTELLPHAAVGLSGAGTSRRWLVEQPHPNTRTVLRFEDGTAALLAREQGAGRVALWTTSFDDDWSDVPLTPGFVALVHDMVRWLAPDAAERRQPVAAGTPVPLRDDETVEAFEVVLPTGERVELAADEGKATLRRTEYVGSYGVRARTSGGRRSSERSHFEVRVDPAESELGTSMLEGTAPVPQRTGAARPRRGQRPLSPWLWLALGAAALAEGLLRVLRVSRRRAGALSPKHA